MTLLNAEIPSPTPAAPARRPAREAERFALPIVYAFPTARWSDFPGRQFALTRALARHTHVIFLEIATDDGGWIDLRRPRAERVEPNLTVIRHAFGLRSSRIGRRLARIASWIDGFWLRRALRRLGASDYVYWVSVSEPLLLAGMRTDRLVYDCIDPCFAPEAQASHDARELAFARRAKLVFCTAVSLLDRLRPANDRAVLLPNAAPDCLNRWPDHAARPPILAHARPPIIGYMGTVDWRFDARFVAALARALPNATVCIVGRVNADQAARVAELRSLPNVVFTGPVSIEEGDRFVASFDIGLIPFLPGPMGDGVNPVKMYMYLAAGKPILSTLTRECARHAPFVRVASDGAEAAAIVPELLNVDPAAARRFASGETWSHRAAEAIAELTRSFG